MTDKPYPITWSEIVTIFGFWGILFSVLNQFGVPIAYSTLTIIIPFVVISSLIHIRYYNEKEFEFVKHNYIERYTDYVKQVKPDGRIWVTHVWRGTPTKAYLDALHEANERGVRIRRVVGAKESNLDKEEWTKWIIPEVKSKSAVHSFLDIGDCDILFEFIIFKFDGNDRKIGAIALPERDLPRRVSSALFSSNKDFVMALETMFEGYEEQSKKP